MACWVSFQLTHSHICIGSGVAQTLEFEWKPQARVENCDHPLSHGAVSGCGPLWKHIIVRSRCMIKEANCHKYWHSNFFWDMAHSLSPLGIQLRLSSVPRASFERRWRQCVPIIHHSRALDAQ